jgi:hypothetical protein
LWALLGVPAVLAVHFLQQQTQPALVSTLFLLEHVAPESAQGSRLDRFRPTPQLWFQLAAVAVLTWLLIQPRWMRADSVQRVVVVLDSTASMSAFSPGLGKKVGDALVPLARVAGTTEWRVEGSHPADAAVYHGTRLDELVQRVQEWRPRRGAHSFDDALEAARGVAGTEGVVVLVTDHPSGRTVTGVDVIGVGEPIQQVGFAGLEMLERDGGWIWRATVRNFGWAPARRSWRLEGTGEIRKEAFLELAPDASRVIEGEFAGNAESLTCVLESDRFALDDRLPMVRPRRKTLRLANATGPDLDDFTQRLIALFEPVVRVDRSDEPDLELTAYRPGVLPDTARNRISFPLPAPPGSPTSAAGRVVAADHWLTRDLTWQGLLCQSADLGAMTDGDEILLWQGATPIVLLRSQGKARQLIVGFELATSNADRLPAFVLMLHRFAESVRARSLDLEIRNVELGQRLQLAARIPGADVVMRSADGSTLVAAPPSAAGRLRAPSDPGAFTVAQGEEIRLHGAAHFADVREADLRHAASFNALEPRVRAVRRMHTEPDRFAGLWILMAGVCVLGSWAAART